MPFADFKVKSQKLWGVDFLLVAIQGQSSDVEWKTQHKMFLKCTIEQPAIKVKHHIQGEDLLIMWERCNKFFFKNLFCWNIWWMGFWIIVHFVKTLNEV